MPPCRPVARHIVSVLRSIPHLPLGLEGLCPDSAQTPKSDHRSLTRPGTSHGWGDPVSCLSNQRVRALPLWPLGLSLPLPGPQPACLSKDTAGLLCMSDIAPLVKGRFPGIPPTMGLHHMHWHTQSGEPREARSRVQQVLLHPPVPRGRLLTSASPPCRAPVPEVWLSGSSFQPTAHYSGGYGVGLGIPRLRF